MTAPINEGNSTTVITTQTVRKQPHKRKRGEKDLTDGLDLNAIISTERSRQPATRNEEFVSDYDSSDKEGQYDKKIKKRAVSQVTIYPNESEDETDVEDIDGVYFESSLILSSEEVEDPTTAEEDFDNGNYWDPNQTGGAPDKSISKSVDHYKKAAKKLHPMALFRLGVLHETATLPCNGGVKKAAKLYEKAGDAGLADGWNNLGALYLNEELDVRDCKERAAACFQKAINSTNPCLSAHNSLGICLEQGLGVDKDVNLARLHYQIGAEGGDHDAQYNLAVQYEHGRGQDRDYFNVGITQSDERASYWHQRSLQNPLNTSVEWSCYALGKLGLKGRINGVGALDERLINLIKQAAERKFPLAMIKLAEIKQYDKPQEAFSLLKETVSVEPENGKAQYRLALCFLKGIGTEQSAKIGLKLLKKAVEAKYCLIKQEEWGSINDIISPQDSEALLLKMKNNHPDHGQIHYELALHCLEKRSIREGMQYFNKAVELNNCLFDGDKVLSIIKRAAKEKNLEAIFELVDITLNGDLGVVASPSEAIYMLSQAIIGHPESGEAMYRFALYHLDGIGMERNIKSAADILKDATACGYQIKTDELLEKFNTLKTDADNSNNPQTLLETAWCLEAGLGEREETLKYCREIIKIVTKFPLNKKLELEATDIIIRIGNDLTDSVEPELIKEGVAILTEACQLGSEKALKLVGDLASKRLQTLQNAAENKDPDALKKLAELALQQLR